MSRKFAFMGIRWTSQLLSESKAINKEWVTEAGFDQSIQKGCEVEQRWWAGRGFEKLVIIVQRCYE